MGRKTTLRCLSALDEFNLLYVSGASDPSVFRELPGRRWRVAWLGNRPNRHGSRRDAEQQEHVLGQFRYTDPETC